MAEEATAERLPDCGEEEQEALGAMIGVWKNGLHVGRR